VSSQIREAFEFLCGLVLPDGRHWGEVATPLQKRDARAVMSRYGARRHWIGRARGYSKTEDLAALTVVAMLLLLKPGSEAYAVARDRDQARILVDRVKGFIRRSELEGAFEHLGTYTVTTKGGTRLEALSCDVGSAWGLSPSWAVIDELCQHPETQAARDLYDAVISGLPKVKGSVLAIITTSGSPGHWSRRVFEHAEREDGWRVSMAYGPCPWMDKAEVAEAERALPAFSFERLFRNRWTQGDDRLFDAADVDACVTLPGPLDYVPGRVYAMGVDAALRRDAAAVAVAHREDDVVVLDRLDVFVPSKGRDIDLQALEELIAVRARQFGHCPVVYDPAMLQGAAQRLQAARVRMVEFAFSASSNSDRTLALLRLVRERRLRLPNDRELVNEMMNLRIRETSPGVYRHDHDASKHDDRVTALSLAAVRLLDDGAGPATISVSSGRLPSRDQLLGVDPHGRLTRADGSQFRLVRGSTQAQIGGLH
jgi:phage terminase large subunit-like protein